MADTIVTRRPGGVRTFFTGGVADAGSFVLLDTTDIAVSPGELSKYDYFVFLGAGTYEVIVSYDGTNWSTPVGLVDLCSVSTTPVLAGVADHAMGLSGCFMHLKVTSLTGNTEFNAIASKLSG